MSPDRIAALFKDEKALQMQISDSIPDGMMYFMSLPPAEEKVCSLEELAEWYRKHPNKCGKVTSIGV